MDWLAVKYILFWLFLVLLAVGSWIGSSYMEAKQYNKVTGGSATTLDAMFLQYRIQLHSITAI